jgi:hypothetical protein
MYNITDMLVFHSNIKYFRGLSQRATFQLWNAFVVDRCGMLCELYPRCIINDAEAHLRTGYFEVTGGKLNRYGILDMHRITIQAFVNSPALFYEGSGALRFAV